ncbi:MAG: acetylglucosamine-6-sulfatase [Planctomycetaceae bacterium]|nr:acetylglucosamine-6-sulfatase [Planctomycetaceae bacterium]
MHRFVLTLLLLLSASVSQAAPDLALPKTPGAKPRNFVFILSDDHRYDVMSFLGHPWVETPAMDAMAREGVYFKNAMVTTSLCSPSRASVLTGQYMHNHGVVDNGVLTPPGTVFFPQYLQKAGYQTGYFGKWHMGGHSDAPRPGFDRWVSFRGQGHYYPPKHLKRWSLNVDGKSVPQKGYITDELTDYAVEWLNKSVKGSDKPFFMYLSHKGVHGMFYPAKRHAGRYKDKPLPKPVTMANTPENYKGKPLWLKNQRNSWHGVDFAYHQDTDIAEHYRLYCEALLSVDDSIARVRKWLADNNLAENTLVLYMGDNGFQWGEHGLIDKRTAYEASMRVPLLGVCPKLWKPGTTIESVVANIDIGPTSLAAAGLETPTSMDGESFLDLAAGKTKPDQWRQNMLYEYYWEFSFPQTPTTFALRTQRYKFIQYHGIWDVDELYDMQADPHERHNLIFDPEHAKRVRQMRTDLHDILVKADANRVPFSHKRSMGANLRLRNGSKPAKFPPELLRNKNRDE